MNLKFLSMAAAAVMSIVATGCGVTRMAFKGQEIHTELECNAVPELHFNNMSRGVILRVKSDVSNDNLLDLSELDSKLQKLARKNTYTFSPTLREFVDKSMTSYMRKMGISVGNDYSNDYNLQVTVRDFKLIDGAKPRVVVLMDYSLYNNHNELLMEKTVRTRYQGVTTNGIAMNFERGFTKTLEDIDWQSIAMALQETSRQAAEEPKRKVTGEGDTALEHTVIRWYIVSAPQGADVSWRVVSSTPDVKNTNATYVGTTPYETTESFDIKGLTYETAGNVQIEITCEKPGYITQRRRFNLRQAIDQREISAKFNLVKEED